MVYKPAKSERFENKLFGAAKEIARAEDAKNPYSFVFSYRSPAGRKRTVAATLPFKAREIKEVIYCSLPGNPNSYIVLRTHQADWSIMPRRKGEATDLAFRRCHYYRAIPPAWDPIKPESFSANQKKLSVNPGYSHFERRFDWLVRQEGMPAQQAIKKILDEAETLYLNQLIDSPVMKEVYAVMEKFRRLKG